jgi:hypothetical protein
VQPHRTSTFTLKKEKTMTTILELQMLDVTMNREEMNVVLMSTASGICTDTGFGEAGPFEME